MDNIKTIGRWVAVLPSWLAGVIIGGFLINILFAIIGFFSDYASDSIWALFMQHGLSPFISALLGMYLGIKVAPSHKKITSIFLFTLTIILSVAGIILAYLVIDESEVSIFWNFLFSIASISGAGYFLYHIFETGEDFNPFQT